MTGLVMVTRGGGCGNVKSSSKESANTEMQNQQQLSLVDFILAALRKSMVSCRVERQEEAICNAVHQMEIGWPTNVQHLTHVTFDRFHGFLGLPVEFEVEIPCRVPSARFVPKSQLFFSSCFVFIYLKFLFRVKINFSEKMLVLVSFVV